MFPPKPVYPDLQRISILFDTDDSKQAALLRALRASFGDGHARSDDLDPPRYWCLDLLPGGAREVLRRASRGSTGFPHHVPVRSVVVMIG
jgi:hypothetical protein